MQNIKSFNKFNEELNWKKGIAGAALGASLLSSPIISKGHESINKIDTIYNKSNNFNDTILNNILSEIKNNKSNDNSKYIELFNKLSNHLSKEYKYEIKNQEISDLDTNSINKMTIIEILGWLGSICLAICGLPQAWLSYKDKHSDGISWSFLLLWMFGEAFALVYVYDKLDLPLLLNYLTNILIVGIILYFKINSKSK